MTTENLRAIRGYSMLAQGREPRTIDRETFLVPSQSSNKKYRVVHRGNDWTCECPDFQFRDVECKHILSVKLWLEMKEKIKSKPNFNFSEESEKSRCVYCNSEKIIKRGKRNTSIGFKQRFFCKSCNRKFIFDIVKRVKGNSKIITLVIDLYYKGLSLRDIQDTVYQFFRLKVHHETIRRWIMKFVKAMNEYVDRLDPKLSEAWHVDEQMIKIKGKWLWNWNLLDEQTRFLIASQITKNREIDDARKVFKKAKKITGDRPEFIISDGLQSYGKAISKEFNKWRLPRTSHIRLETIRKKPNNNLIERFHSTFRERDKVMRGFKSKNTAQILTDGFRTYYNFVRPHTALNGLTPSDTAGIGLNLDGNRWLGLLELSLKNNGNINHREIKKERPVRKPRQFLLKVFDESNDEVNGREFGMKTEFQEYENAQRFIEFYKQLHPNFRFEVC